MLGGLAKSNIWVAKPGVFFRVSLSPSPRHAQGLGTKPTQGSSRPKDTILNEYDASCRYEHAWSERSPDLSPSLLLTVIIRQPSHEFTFGVGMTFVSYPLVLTPMA
jgi:hypothetical protein